jgi:hypothetical protein
MSPRTVEYHLHKVFTKLDITSRKPPPRRSGQPPKRKTTAKPHYLEPTVDAPLTGAPRPKEARMPGCGLGIPQTRTGSSQAQDFDMAIRLCWQLDPHHRCTIDSYVRLPGRSQR